jgi:hypothetical protein
LHSFLPKRFWLLNGLDGASGLCRMPDNVRQSAELAILGSSGVTQARGLASLS